MSSDAHLTTGEAAQFLGLSRSTVSRKFDQGHLRGKTHPITGERLISRESILAFMRQYNLAPGPEWTGRRNVLVATPDDGFFASLAALAAGDRRVIFERAVSGADALVQAAASSCALLILDDALDDLAMRDVVRALRAAVRAVPLSILCCSEARVQESLEENAADEHLRKSDLETRGASTLYRLLNLSPSEEEPTRQFEHLRQWRRVRLDLPCELSVYRIREPARREAGRAMIGDISCGGASLYQVELETGSLPMEPFRVILRADRAPLNNFKAHAQVVRLISGGQVTLAVQFVKISKTDLDKIERLVAGQA